MAEHAEAIPRIYANDSVRGSVGRERERLFVGRQAEFHHLTDWFEGHQAPTRVLSIQGMGGIGKSTLLVEMLRRAANVGTVTVLVDGHACARSPAGVLEYVGTLLGERPDASLARLNAIVRGGGRVVLGVDNYDELQLLEGWLREEMVGNLPSEGVLIILASRRGVSSAWLADPAWHNRIDQLPISPFTRHEVVEYLNLAGLADQLNVERLIRETEGLPLALALGVEHLSRLPDETDIAAQQVGAHLLFEVATPGLHAALEVLTILPEADQELLSAILDEPLNLDRYHQLAQLSFVRDSAHGLVLHDTAQAHLLAYLRRRAPGRYRLLQRQAVAALRTRLKTVRRGERQRYVTHLLTICRDALPVHPLSDLTTRPNLLELTPYEPGDRPRLHTILDAWIRQSCQLTELAEEHRLLDDLCDHSPESVWTLRVAGGECLAFMTHMLLHRETAARLEQYRTGAIYLKQCPALERETLNCSPEQADTYFSIGGFASLDSKEYAPGELFGVIIHAQLALLGEGMRLMGFGNNPAFLEQIDKLGFRARPEYRAEWGDSPWPFVVIELDLRRRDFGEWATSLLDALESAPPPARFDEDDAEVLGELKDALDALDDPVRTRSLAIARRLGQPSQGFVAHLRAVLAVEVPPLPLRREDQQILRSAFPRRYMSREEAAERLHISRATYYRRLHLALTRLADVFLH